MRFKSYTKLTWLRPLALLLILAQWSVASHSVEFSLDSFDHHEHCSICLVESSDAVALDVPPATAPTPVHRFDGADLLFSPLATVRFFSIRAPPQ